MRVGVGGQNNWTIDHSRKCCSGRSTDSQPLLYVMRSRSGVLDSHVQVC